MRWIFKVTFLVFFLALVHGQRYVPFDKLSIEELKNLANSPNRQVYQQWFLDKMLRTMDLTADPCEDFYQFACGNYDAMRPQNHTFEQMSPYMETIMLSSRLSNDLILSTAQNSESDSKRKVWNFYRSCMDIKHDPHTPLDFVKSFGSWPAFDNYWTPDSFDWIQRMVELSRLGVKFLLNCEVDGQHKGKEYVDTGNLECHATQLYGDEPSTQKELLGKLRTFFSAHLPASYIEDMSHRIFSFQTQMNRLTSLASLEEEFHIHELRRVTPSCDFTKIVKLMIDRQPNPTNTIKLAKDITEQTCAFVERTNKRTVADAMLYYLYDYAQKEMSTLKNMDNEELQTKCLDRTTKLLQPILASMFVERYVSEESKKEFTELTKNLQKLAVEMMLSETKWLDEVNRRRAVRKMEGISYHIIYPLLAELPDTSLDNVNIDAGNFLQNVRRLEKVKFEDMFGMLGKPMGSLKFNTLVVEIQMVNGYRGHVHIQAAALQPPLYSYFAPSFWKFGSPLAIIGHETMHAFDAEKGVKWDEFGHMNHMISPSRQLAHQMRSVCFYDQFENFKIAGTDLHVKGALTLAENVADNDGLKIAFKLFKQWMTENPDIVWQEEFSFAPLQLSHEQAFFVSYGQTWCDHRSFEKLVDDIETDEHSPAKFRLIGGASNSPDFARVFNCPVNSKMNPSEKCSYFFD